MVKHYIIMSSSYTDGSRVALDITEDCFLNSKAIAEMIEEIRKNCGKDVPLSTHFIETEFGVRIFHWKNSFIMHMRTISASVLSGYLKITFMHSVMVLSLTVSMRLLSEVAPNM